MALIMGRSPQRFNTGGAHPLCFKSWARIIILADTAHDECHANVWVFAPLYFPSWSTVLGLYPSWLCKESRSHVHSMLELSPTIFHTRYGVAT